jgi:hypothetical protein
MRFRVSFTRIRYDTPTWGHRTRHQPIPFIRMCYPAAYREEERREEEEVCVLSSV